MTSSPATDQFRAARDLLLELRSDYAAAREQFTPPRPEHFNWALDWFDQVAAAEPTRSRPALRVVEADGSEVSMTYGELADRSSQLAAWLQSRGADRGDRLLLMLGNQAELWETLLACIKLGVVVIPASTLLATADLHDRVERGHVRHVIARSEDAPKFAGVPGGWTRIAVGEDVDGWLAYGDSLEHLDSFTPEVATRADETLLLYFTSGTTAQPKLVEHTHASYPIGHLTTMYWIGLQPGDVHLNISSPGWAKHAWSNVFAPWNAEATVLIVNQPRFDAPTLLDAMERCGATTFCAPPTVWRMLVQADLAAFRGRIPLREVVGAGEPLNPEVIEQVERAWGVTVRDGFGQTETTLQVGNSPGQPLKPGSMGRPMPGYDVVLLDPLTGEERTEGEICLRLDAPAGRPVGLMVGYRDDDERTRDVMRGNAYHTGDVAARGRRGLHHLRRADGRRLQGVGLPDQPVRAGERADRAPGGRRGRRRAVTRPDPARRPQGLRGPRRRTRADRRDRSVDPGLLPRASGAVQADSPDRVRRAAQDDLRQDPAGRAPRARGRRARRRCRTPRGGSPSTEFWEDDLAD